MYCASNSQCYVHMFVKHDLSYIARISQPQYITYKDILYI